MHAAFSRFIRPGSLIISSSDTNTVAALDSSSGNLILVIRNNAESEVNYIIDLSRFESIGALVQVYRFQLPGSLKKESAIAVNNKQVSFTAPKMLITTCTAPIIQTALKNRATDKKVIEPVNILLMPDDRNLLSYDHRNFRSFSIYDCRGIRFFNAGTLTDDINNNRYPSKRILANGIYIIKQSPLNGAEDIYHNK